MSSHQLEEPALDPRRPATTSRASTEYARSRPGTDRAVRIGLVAASDLVAGGLAAMLDGFGDRAELVPCDPSAPRGCDIVLVGGSFAGGGGSRCVHDLAASGVPLILIFSSGISREDARRARADGAHGHVSTSLRAAQLVSTLEAWRSRGARRVRHLAVAPPPPPEPAELLARQCLTDREREVVTLICQGQSNAEIAGELCITDNTVKTHIRNAYRKIGTTRRSQVVVWGLSNGL